MKQPAGGENTASTAGDPASGEAAFGPAAFGPLLGGNRRGPVRRVLFFGKNMSRSRCTGGLVDAWQAHGVTVRWRNLVTWRRWVGQDLAMRLARAEFRAFKPDVVFVFFRDLPLVLADEFRQHARLVIWCEEMLGKVDPTIVDYFRLADLVCMSNPSRFPILREHGLDRMVFLMSGFSPRFHRPAPVQPKIRDVAFVGGPGYRGQRAELLAKIARHFDTEVFGMHWNRWAHVTSGVRVRRPIDNRGYAKVCASSRIVLGVNETNEDAGYFSNRTFLTLACGGFHLTHYVPGLEHVFTKGEHLDWFDGEHDVLDRIAFWLRHDDERARIAAGGHAEVLRHHQYGNRVARIMHWLEHGLPRADQEAPRSVRAAGGIASERAVEG
jgi:hypothetical protein